ncbi:DUF421 domain-containing protein [Neobacillus bataviensis]|uniref:DUF421 domain-containing protein n=1 Tax=Neobacillus bataviensis TaxID=220685 RepID=UPI001CBD2AB1|nr:YetF domain-containing protein [Neobacillus bataviensis]
MDLSVIWKSLILIAAGTLLLRISGRKSIAQMTLAQTIVIIAIGTIIVQPIVEKSVTKTIAAAAVFVATLLILEYLQIKFNFFEKLLTGKSKVVIENGVLNVKALKKLRLTVDHLEMRMRNEGIAKIEDIKYATLEPNGLLGYELKDDAKPVTVGELKKILDLYFPKAIADNTAINKEQPNIFTEINQQSKQDHPDYLQ